MSGGVDSSVAALLMKKKGYENIRVTPKSKDVGKDIVMESQEGEIILVECKHQSFVGRPVIQKLQGAMSHEEKKHREKEVRGIIVTSGSFSKAINYNKEIGEDIEFIDGKKLRTLCKELNVVILNGKVQILTNKSFISINEKESKDLAKNGYSKIYWSKEHSPSIKTKLKFSPACFINYNVDFDTSTSVGCIDSYSDSGEIIIDGINGEALDSDTAEFFFSGRVDTKEIGKSDEQKKIPFEFTENDIEEHAINRIIKEHTHEVSYTGGNNVSYSKICIPKRRDIDIKQFLPVYLPIWVNEIDIMRQKYKQEFYVKGNNQFYIEDDLRKCKICGREEDDYGDMNLCPECGRIVCDSHKEIDYLDEKTPICEIHAKPFQPWIEEKYFAKKETLQEYKKMWESMSFLEKIFEDNIVAGGISVVVVVVFTWILIRLIS